ncbi:MAG TPA: DUF4262 domain-containing protein [Acidimicrobiales bacterium]|nr:DUF4262 domain-containing protein [Acidimicrobiales bacterium]
MCAICDGQSEEDFLTNVYRHVADRGFTVMAVGKTMEGVGWAYTIGLIVGYDHPELVVAGKNLREAVGVLQTLGACVTVGDRLDTAVQHGLTGTAIGVVPVHQCHLDRGLMAYWERYYDSLARFDVKLRAVQIVLPDEDHCYEHQRDQPDLGRACHVSFDGMGPRDRRRAHIRASTRARSSRPRRGGRLPPATAKDLYRHRRSTRRQR